MKRKDAQTGALVRKAAAGDEGAFAELVRRHEGPALRLAQSITRDRAEAEDAVQEAFLRAYRNLERFDPERPFGPWIMKIAANRALSRSARRSKHRALEADPAPAEEPGLDAALTRKEELRRVQDAVAALPPLDRAIIGLRYEQGLKVSDISRSLGLTLSAAKVRLFRARERLMKLLGGRQ